MKIMQHIIKIILFLSISSVGFGETLELENNEDGTWNVKYVSEVDFSGFQFTVDGVEVTGAGGGDAEAAGFMISSSASTVLGFSFTGATIYAGDGILVILELTGEPTGLSGIVISDSSGNSIDFTFIWLGCMNETACNYNPDSTQDDGSCLVNDCAGECGGDAIDDECDVCDSDSSNDCMQDCAGNWGGNLVDDECGVCGGDGVDADDDGICDDVDDCVVEEGVSQECGCNTGIAEGACDCDGNVDLGCGCGAAGPSGCDDTCGSTLENDECGVCGGDAESCTGCMDENACNYNPNATSTEGCLFPCSTPYGCEEIDNNYDCDGNCSVGLDCVGICGGSVTDNETCTGCMDNGYQQWSPNLGSPACNYASFAIIEGD